MDETRISKTEFAKRIGVSTPTLYAWIRKNKDGIQQFVNDEGIAPDIFEVEPWNAYKDNGTVERQRLQNKVDNAAEKIAELTAERDMMQIRIESMQQTIDLLQGQLTAKDQQINALLVSLNLQMKALPQPKKHWWQRRNRQPEE